MDIVREKIEQAGGILDQLGIDLWLVYVRETPVLADPVLPLVAGLHATWESFLAYTRDGRAFALIGDLDKADYLSSDRFTEVRTYVAGVGEDLRKLLAELNPSKIAINYSTDNVSADGLTHGLYLRLCEYLKGTPYVKRLVSAEEICGKLRARKTKMEISRLEAAANLANDVWNSVQDRLQVGMSEIEVAGVIDNEITARGATRSFVTVVNAGDKTDPGHGSPTDARLEPGDLMHIDFGVRLDDYCSDIQRLLYFNRPGEISPPPELIEAFETVRDIITEASIQVKPGIKGHELDAAARRTLVDRGYPEYQHALGHQLGLAVHDGGAILGPKWERYGSTPMIAVEENNVFTLELEIMLPGIGCVGLEEDIVVTEKGGRFLCPRQTELRVK